MLPIYARRAVASLALAVLSLVTACGDAGGSSERDIRLAPSGKAQSKLNDVPEKGGARAAEPGGIRKLLGLGPKTGTIGAGTAFEVRPSARVCTNTHRTGSTVTATTTAALNGSNGAVIPAGSAVDLRVRESARSEDSKDKVRLAFDVVAVHLAGATYPVEGRVTQPSDFELVRAQSTAKQAEKVGVGAAIGALAGQVIGKNTRSTVTGAVVGAAAGTAVAMGTADYDGCLRDGARIAVALTSPLKVVVEKKSS